MLTLLRDLFGFMLKDVRLVVNSSEESADAARAAAKPGKLSKDDLRRVVDEAAAAAAAELAGRCGLSKEDLRLVVVSAESAVGAL